MICDPSVVVYQDVDPVACTFYQLGVLVSALVLTAATGVTLARIVRLGILRWIPEKLTLALLFLFTLLELTRSVLLVGGALPVAQWLLSVTTQPFVYASSSCVLYFWVTTYHGDKNRNLVRGSFILGMRPVWKGGDGCVLSVVAVAAILFFGLAVQAKTLAVLLLLLLFLVVCVCFVCMSCVLFLFVFCFVCSWPCPCG